MQRQEERDCIIHIKEPELTAIINASHYALQSASASLSLSLSNQINMLYWHEWKYDINIGKKRGTEQQKVEMNRKISQCFKV